MCRQLFRDKRAYEGEKLLNLSTETYFYSTPLREIWRWPTTKSMIQYTTVISKGYIKKHYPTGDMSSNLGLVKACHMANRYCFTESGIIVWETDIFEKNPWVIINETAKCTVLGNHYYCHKITIPKTVYRDKWFKTSTRPVIGAGRYVLQIIKRIKHENEMTKYHSRLLKSAMFTTRREGNHSIVMGADALRESVWDAILHVLPAVDQNHFDLEHVTTMLAQRQCETYKFSRKLLGILSLHNPRVTHALLGPGEHIGYPLGDILSVAKCMTPKHYKILCDAKDYVKKGLCPRYLAIKIGNETKMVEPITHRAIKLSYQSCLIPRPFYHLDGENYIIQTKTGCVRHRLLAEDFNANFDLRLHTPDVTLTPLMDYPVSANDLFAHYASLNAALNDVRGALYYLNTGIDPDTVAEVGESIAKAGELVGKAVFGAGSFIGSLFSGHPFFVILDAIVSFLVVAAIVFLTYKVALICFRRRCFRDKWQNKLPFLRRRKNDEKDEGISLEPMLRPRESREPLKPARRPDRLELSISDDYTAPTAPPPPPLQRTNTNKDSIVSQIYPEIKSTLKRTSMPRVDSVPRLM